MIEKENLITRMNYSPRIQGLFIGAVFGVVGMAFRGIERSDLREILPLEVQGHASDIFYTGVVAGGLRGVLGNILGEYSNIHLYTAASLIGCTASELAQIVHIAPGTYDSKDLAAFFFGSLVLEAWHFGAVALYNSELTKPLYKLLCIQDNRD